MSLGTRRLLFSLYLLAVTAVWGWTFVVVKDAIARYGVMGFLAVRFAIAAATLALFGLRRFTRTGFLVGCGIGLMLVIAYALQTYGLRYTSATNGGLITGLFVVFGSIWNRALFGVRTSPLCWVCVAASMVGLGLLTGAGPTPPNLGDFLTFGCAIAFGAHIALLDRYAKRHDPTCLAMAQMATAAVVFLAVWPAVEHPAWPGPTVWGALLITGVAASALGFLGQTSAQRELPAIRASMLLTMEPVFAVAFGMLLAGDRLAPWQIAGGAIMVGALVVSDLVPHSVPSEPVARR
jgi:drug/metabolite transporter (DMT)-like permease